MFKNISKKISLTIKTLLFLCSLIFAAYTFANDTHITPQTLKLQYGNIPVLILHGNYTQMGVEYGQALQAQLQKVLSIPLLPEKAGL